MVMLLAIIGLALGTYLIRVSGVVLRDKLVLPERVKRLLPVAATTLLAALVATAIFTDGGHLSLGVARPLGVATGALLAWRKAPFVVVVLAAAAVAALLRLSGLP